MNNRNALLGALQSRNARTENGAVTNSTVGNSVLDFFGLGGALRSRPETDIVRLFNNSFYEDKLLALKTLFYFRDVRKGQGERRTFRAVLKSLAQDYPDVVRANLANIPYFGRFDDLFVLFGTAVESDMVKLVHDQLMKDMSEADVSKVSLLAKWMPSENASSSATKQLARRFIAALKVRPNQYRKMLSHLRAQLNLVETAMAQNEWAGINYSHVPSKAMTNYRKAFSKHDADRFVQFLKAVEKGETKINASTLYPYDVVDRVLNSRENDAVLEAQWKALPDYCDGTNALVVADTSGSMSGVPIRVCLSLALYMAERNTGAFNGYFLTFNNNSQLQKVSGATLRQKLTNLNRADWGGSTNLQSAFDSILNAAIRDRVPAAEMPKKLFIVSDMEFNSCVSGTNYDQIRAKYAFAGYELPEIIFWNVNARNDQSPITVNDKACLVSGYSPSILRAVLSGVQITPTDVMLETLNNERYDRVTL